MGKMICKLLTLLANTLVYHFITLSAHFSPSSATIPTNFLFGAASSAYQYEGAYLSDGKGLNNWDVFTHKSGKIKDNSNGDVATDHYHHYLMDQQRPFLVTNNFLDLESCKQEDVKLMANMGLNSYRFSISWARILPKGRYGGINFAGIRFYSKLIDALLLRGIQPFVTLSHFDIPQELEDRYGGWLSPQLQEDFTYYADVCFKYFGDRVKHWVTFNEPNVAVVYGYRTGQYPPGRCSSSFGNCSQGDSEKEPFIAAHNIILAHAAVVNLYRTKYKEKQGGIVGIVLHALWLEPISESPSDKVAVERAQSFFMKWFLDPIMFGEYPAEMRKILGPNLPRFSNKDLKVLHTAADFIGINHYTSFYVRDCMYSACKYGRGVSWTEGHVQESNQSCSTNDLLNDGKRVEYMAGYLDALLRTISNGADVRGYFAWSLLDNFEWLEGYTKRFGLYHVDYATLKRSPKSSVSWYKEFIAKHRKQTILTEGENRSIDM
ncbi:hypothetical protein Cgig2_019744 [Carnegiea gigantea]|uniref:Beta-glucosidase n=1 Tax=Carnegiea gigantea TaxID=171969 RepID=A0A9Q1KLD6_9CARY|nr:hypothetical protein Cgig2_019744 [Carnegiea gigantea]